MKSLALSRPTNWMRFHDVLKTLVPSQDGATPTEDSKEDSRTRRDVILDLLESNPDAFQSELDIQHFAYLYRCKF